MTGTLPHNLDAEKSILGGILLSPVAFAQVADTVAPADFYHPAHEAIYAAMVALDQAHRPIDLLTVADQLRVEDTLGRLRSLGGEAYFGELSGAVVTVENIAFYARMVADLARVRRLAEAADQVAAKARSGDFGDAGEFIGESEKALFAATQSGPRAGYVPLQKILGPVIKTLEARFDHKRPVTGVPSGFEALDELTAGFQPSDLVIIAARPGMGKTSLVMNALQNAALDHAIPSLVFSLEMSKEQLVERMLSSGARIDSTRVRSGYLEARDFIGLAKHASRLSEARISIDDDGSPSLLEIRARARRWRAQHPIAQYPLAAIAVDYLQLIDAQRDKGESTADAVGRVSRGLKALAKELRVPVLALSQLNRDVEKRGDKRPTLADLRDSGAIEQDADVVAFIYRDEVYDENTKEPGIAEIIVAKHRSGPIGFVKLGFEGPTTSFRNLPKQEPSR